MYGTLYSSPFHARSALAKDQAVKWAKAAVCVYADSILCVGQVKHISGATERWKGPVEDLKKSSSYQDAVGIDGEAIVFEWHNLPGFSSLSVLEEIRRESLAGKKIQPEEFKDRIIFMSMCNGIAWSKGKNDENCIANAGKVRNHAMRFSQGHWTFLGPRSEEMWYGDFRAQKGEWDS